MRSEFLMTVSEIDGFRKYPVHILATLMDAAPWTSGTTDPHSRLASWSEVVARGMSSSATLKHAIRDIARSLSEPTAKVIKWL